VYLNGAMQLLMTPTLLSTSFRFMSVDDVAVTSPTQ